MSIYRIGYDDGQCQATLYNHGCNWNCSICSYKLREDMAPKRFLSTRDVVETLSSFKVDKLVVLGGEPLTCKDLAKMIAAAKEQGAWTKLAHSNASILPPEGVDEMGVSLRAVTKRKHIQLTGVPNTKVLGNLYTIHDRGVRMHASCIMIPDVVDAVEVGKIAEFLAGVDEEIPLHITAFIPVPGLHWRAPTKAELAEAMRAALVHLKHVDCARLSVKDFLESSARQVMQHRDGVY